MAADAPPLVLSLRVYAGVDIHFPFEQRLQGADVPLFWGSVQRNLCLVSPIVIRAVLSCVQYLSYNTFVFISSLSINFATPCKMCYLGHMMPYPQPDQIVTRRLKQLCVSVFLTHDKTPTQFVVNICL